MDPIETQLIEALCKAREDVGVLRAAQKGDRAYERMEKDLLDRKIKSLEARLDALTPKPGKWEPPAISDDGTVVGRKLIGTPLTAGELFNIVEGLPRDMRLSTRSGLPLAVYHLTIGGDEFLHIA